MSRHNVRVVPMESTVGRKEKEEQFGKNAACSMVAILLPLLAAGVFVLVGTLQRYQEYTYIGIIQEAGRTFLNMGSGGGPAEVGSLYASAIILIVLPPFIFIIVIAAILAVLAAKQKDV